MYKKIINLLFLVNFLYSGQTGHHIDFPLFSIIPFIGILLSIAIIPLINHHFWEMHYGKVSFFWASLFFIPLLIIDAPFAFEELILVVFTEYLPFIILLLALFTIAGGIQLKGTLVGTPQLNSGLILLGTVLASWMGTTGAAMLLIRPLIRANKHRKCNVHIIIFFILLVANIGGSLTPLGDPPLFLGFLQGVDFFWTMTHLFVPMLIHVVFLLLMFFLLDSYFYNKEDCEISSDEEKKPLEIKGKLNLLLILGVVGAVLMSGTFELGEFKLSTISLKVQNVLRDVILLGLALLSWKITDRKLRKSNGFTWFPILEVAKLFAGIFITIIPAISILKAGVDGPLYKIVELTTYSNGDYNNFMYFWLTGILSGFLDNAPTYLVFFNTAGGNAYSLMHDFPKTLLAISSGSVFFGALTYIGNAPNFMVRSIAEENDIKMPSFFGYIGWSAIILMPIFTIYSILFF